MVGWASLDEYGARIIHDRQATVNVRNGNPVLWSLLWQTSWVKKCPLLVHDNSAHAASSKDKPIAKDGCDEAVRPLKSLDQGRKTQGLLKQSHSVRLQRVLKTVQDGYCLLRSMVKLRKRRLSSEQKHKQLH